MNGWAIAVVMFLSFMAMAAASDKEFQTIGILFWVAAMACMMFASGC